MSLLHPGITAFQAIVRLGTVHAAAQDIGLSQTGVTQRIRALERDLGATLFVRSRRGMRLTAEGEALVRWCQRVDDLEGALLSFVRRDAPATAVRVTITGPSSLMRRRVIPAVSAVLADHANVVATFLLDDQGAGLAHLKTGVAQLAALPRTDVVNELDAKLLAPVRLRLLGPAAWAGRDAAEVVRTERIIDFNAQDDATFAFLREHGLPTGRLRQRHLVNSPDALAELVAAGRGFSVLEEEFAAPLLADGLLTDLCPGRVLQQELALAWYPRHEMPGYFQAIIDAVA
jgi:LysR family transcriptional regulator (chromosome initiation inhibitor)